MVSSKDQSKSSKNRRLRIIPCSENRIQMHIFRSWKSWIFRKIKQDLKSRKFGQFFSTKMLLNVNKVAVSKHVPEIRVSSLPKIPFEVIEQIANAVSACYHKGLPIIDEAVPRYKRRPLIVTAENPVMVSRGLLPYKRGYHTKEAIIQ